MKLLRKFRAFFRREKLDAEMTEEMRAHLELQTAANERRGMSAEEARFAALREFGGVEQIKERARDQRTGQWLETVWRDLVYGVRGLWRQPGFTCVAVLTLGFGIGVNTTVFSIIQDLIGRPADRDRDRQLVTLHLARRGAERGFRSFSLEEFEAVQSSGLFARAAALEFSGARVGPKNNPRQKLVCFVTEDYFPLLGVSPLRGRFFSAEETRPNADRAVIVASYDFWQRLGAPADFVGSQLEIDGRVCVVVGIAPRGFGGLQWSIGPELWVPMGMAGSIGSGRVNLVDSTRRPLFITARLVPGLTIETANTASRALTETLNNIAGTTADNRVELVVAKPPRGNLDLTAPADESGITRYAALAFGVTIAVLLVACLNVANMLLARGAARQREIAVRLSLGASRGRIVRQLITEGLVLGVAGGVVGLALSRVANEALLALTREISSRQPYSFNLQTTANGELIAMTFALCLLATLACSIGPALRATQLNLAHDLKQQPGDPAASGAWNRFFSGRHILIMLQIAFSVTLLFGAGLFVQSAINVDRDRGFDVARQLVVKLDYSLDPPAKGEMPRLQQALAQQIAALPGVERAALASSVPYNFESSWWRVFGAGPQALTPDPKTQVHAIHTAVSDGYFATLGIPLLRGRDFTAAENAPGNGERKVAIIDERLAKTFFGAADPLGQRIIFNANDLNSPDASRGCEIVGVVRSPHDDPLVTEPPPRVYQPLGQSVHDRVYVHVRTAQPEAVMPALRRIAGSYAPEHPVMFCGLFSEIVDHNLNLWSLRMAAAMFGVFAGAAVFLAAIGVYGVKAYAVARRTREIGVRIALGAETGDVLRLVLKQGMLQALVGITAGVILSAATGQVLSRLLYRVAATDPAVLGLAIGVVMVSALIASAVPAWRATQISPTEALRCE
jgi:putative ABC transport system permease protein